MRKIILRMSILVPLIACSGCASLFQPKTDKSIPFEIYGDINNARHVTVLLPGIRDRITDFQEEGFIDIALPFLREFPDSALITVDAHWGYYRERIIEQRLAEDILARYPKKTFTFVGISLGGFGSLMMATEHRDRIDKLVLLSPFLGDDDYEYLSRLRQSGPVAQEGDEDLDKALNRVWAFMTAPDRKIPVYIAYGEDDSFALYYDHLRSLTPTRLQFLEIRGDHDWETWRTLWRTLAPMAFMQY